MKATIIFLICCINTFLIAADAPESNKMTGRRIEQNLTKWDANQNGRLDPEEMETMRKDRVHERIAQQEARAQAAVEARKMDEAARRTRMVPPTLVKQYDTNTNNLIDLNEWQLYRQDVARQTAERRAARLAAITNAPSPAIVTSTNKPSGP